MKYIERIKKYQKNFYVRAAVLVGLVLIITVVIRLSNAPADEVSDTETLPTVTLASASSLSGGESLLLIGSVRAFSEAQITAERSGRVTSVSAELGNRVTAGQVIATLENASEQAAVLQAQGVYEAALAGAAQSTVGVSEAASELEAAKRAAVNAYTTAFNTVNNIVISNIDRFFANPNSTIPGLRIAGKGLTESLNAERIAYQALLPEWQNKTRSVSESSNLESELSYARTNIQRTIVFVDSFISVFSSQTNDTRYTEAELAAFQTEFTNLRASLIAAQAAVDGARAGLDRANDGVTRATISASGGTTSASDAQVKQALGALRGAQANLAKTILRTPISGTVNSLNVKVGDFVNGFDTVSVIANNNALEIITYVGDLEKDQLVVGDTVRIEDTFTGIITNIAPAVDPVTRKTEVRIATDSTTIANGDTVRITKDAQASSTPVSNSFFIPITAVKFEAEDGYVFTVSEDKTLTPKPITIGAVRGNQVEIREGLSVTDTFVVDARGLTSGTKVTVTE